MHGLQATSHSQVRNEPFACTENIEPVLVRVDGNGTDAQLTCCAHHSAGDFAPVCNQETADVLHRGCHLAVEISRVHAFSLAAGRPALAGLPRAQ